MFTDNIKDMGTNEDKYNVTILIAEDEESNFLLLKTILKRHCNVLQARTGLELLKGNHTIFRLDSQYDVRYLCAVTFKNNDYGKRKSKLPGGI